MDIPEEGIEAQQLFREMAMTLRNDPTPEDIAEASTFLAMAADMLDVSSKQIAEAIAEKTGGTMPPGRFVVEVEDEELGHGPYTR